METAPWRDDTTTAKLLRSTAATLALLAGLGLATQVYAREHEHKHEKIDKIEKIEKVEKAQKAEKVEKVEKHDKHDKNDKNDKHGTDR